MSRVALLALLLLGARVPAKGPPVAPSCGFGAGVLPVDTLRRGTRHGAQIPIDTIVVLMQENRSFDHYFGQLHREGQRRATGEPKNASNPDPTHPSGPPIRAFHEPRYCEVADLAHSWNSTHRGTARACTWCTQT
jgi:phospholipase C